MTYKGHVKNGVVVLDDATVRLPEGAVVDVAIAEAAPRHDSKPTSLYERLSDLISSDTSLPSDASTQKNHYLYGHPKA